jgi:coenzyme A diphosphatase NUDT7
MVGHAAFPGGKADDITETPWETARREAFEEIGLPLSSSSLPKPFHIEHLCELPHSLAMTGLAVRPCVAILHADSANGSSVASVEENMIPRLDAKEVAAVFSAPFHNFLVPSDETPEGEKAAGKWYEGKWIEWHEGPWRMHTFHVPITNQKVSKPKVREAGQSSMAEEDEGPELERYKVWGMTARMLVDAARVAYGEDPQIEVSHITSILCCIDVNELARSSYWR